MYHPRPCFHVPVPPALLEVEEEVHYTKLQQQVRDLLAAQVLGISDLGAEVPYPYGILVPEVCQGLLEVWKVLQV